MACLLGVVIGKAEALEVVVDGFPEVIGDLLGDELGNVSLEVGKDGPAEGEGHDATAKKNQKAECVLFKDLVYGVAEESGDGEGKEGGEDQGDVGQGQVLPVGPEEGREAEERSHKR